MPSTSANVAGSYVRSFSAQLIGCVCRNAGHLWIGTKVDLGHLRKEFVSALRREVPNPEFLFQRGRETFANEPPVFLGETNIHDRMAELMHTNVLAAGSDLSLLANDAAKNGRYRFHLTA